VGRLIVNGLQMALDAVNEGKRERRLEITFADNESTPEGAVKAIGELARDPRILAVAGEINSPFVMAGVPVVNKEELPYLTAGSSPRTRASLPWIFRVGASDALLADFLSGYMVGDLHVKNLAILHEIMHGRTGIHNQRADLITRLLKDKYKIVPVLDTTWAPGDRNFTAQLGAGSGRKTEAIVRIDRHRSESKP
jgi:branched-chain amino acid transport system substrate-binding protein